MTMYLRSSSSKSFLYSSMGWSLKSVQFQPRWRLPVSVPGLPHSQPASHIIDSTCTEVGSRIWLLRGFFTFGILHGSGPVIISGPLFL
ncbi:hypothetical protein [Circoviridae sp.]|nr:hypothetical protein [Circoviridae sp.]